MDIRSPLIQCCALSNYMTSPSAWFIVSKALLSDDFVHSVCAYLHRKTHTGNYKLKMAIRALKFSWASRDSPWRVTSQAVLCRYQLPSQLPLSPTFWVAGPQFCLGHQYAQLHPGVVNFTQEAEVGQGVGEGFFALRSKGIDVAESFFHISSNWTWIWCLEQ